nr:NAD(P)H-dependent oxidoreductase [Pseudanabaena sp. PCC 6802]
MARGYTLLLETLNGFEKAPVLPFDATAIAMFDEMRSQKVRVATMDLRIAAIAISNNLILLARNTGDFSKITNLIIEADFTPPEALSPELRSHLKLSDELVDEFLAADRCLFSVPMYNFSVPSNFKAYIDQIVRVGRTFTFENGQGKGLVSGKKVIFIGGGFNMLTIADKADYAN